MPAPSRKKSGAPPMPVPEPGDTDRKRVLNVLAQRRYRQRKREKQQSLEKRLAAIESGSSESGTLSSASPSSTENAAATPNVDPVQFPDAFFSSLDSIQQPSSLDTSQSASSTSQSPENNSLDLRINPLDDGFIDDRYFPTDDISGFEAELNNTMVPFNDPTLYPNSPSSSSAFWKDVSDAFQEHQSSNFTFPDDATFYHPELAMMRAGFGIATRLSIDATTLWNPNALHTMPLTPGTLSLPMNLRPTALQQQVPHHPFVDILPWPSVRDKIIMVLSQPAEMRPPAVMALDQGEGMGGAMVKLSYDMEDTKEGCRVWGEDFCDEKSWEVGEAMFKHWWWALDRAVVERSNQLRAMRGESKLRIEEIA